MVGRKAVLAQLVGDSEFLLLLFTETVAESKTVVIHAERDIHLHARGMLETNHHLVVRIVDLALLAPYCFPCILNEPAVCALQAEVVGQVLLDAHQA